MLAETTACLTKRLPPSSIARNDLALAAATNSGGQVYLVRFDPTPGSEIKKTRPCVVLSLDELNEHLRTVIVPPMAIAFGRSFQGRAASWPRINFGTVDVERLVRSLANSKNPLLFQCWSACRRCSPNGRGHRATTDLPGAAAIARAKARHDLLNVLSKTTHVMSTARRRPCAMGVQRRSPSGERHLQLGLRRCLPRRVLPDGTARPRIVTRSSQQPRGNTRTAARCAFKYSSLIEERRPSENLGTTWEQLRPNTGENEGVGPTRKQDESTR